MAGNGETTRTINIDRIARVEGEGALTVTVKDGRVQDVHLRIYEAPRYFESFLQGRTVSELPDLVARVCGICPVAYQMSAVHAIEQMLGLRIEGSLRELRRLLYCGEWIESHVLHIYLLHAPDFFGYPSGIDMARDHPELITRGLQMRKVGNQIVALLGGRAIHPVSVRIGGFSRVPSRRELTPLREALLWARDAAVETVRWTAGFEFPDFTQPYRFVAVKPAQEYPMNEGAVAVTDGPEIPAAEFDAHFVETQTPYSHALSCTFQNEPYMVGPLARLHLNYERLSPLSREVLDATGLRLPLLNPFQAIIARAVETLYAMDEAIRIIDRYDPPPAPAVPVAMRSGTGRAATEAPRGLLYHRYRVDADGVIREVRLVPPTSQNQRRIEEDLRAFLPRVLSLPNEQAAEHCERVIRSYDPCISCATHFLRLNVVRA
jgi:coenzyme F420-reducing hydrogenase alpha subunit